MKWNLKDILRDRDMYFNY
jgi:hypothetical protein